MYGNHAFLLPFSQSHTQYRHALARTGGDTKFSFAYVTIGGKSGPAESDRKLKETIKYLACQTQTGPLDHSSIEISSIILYSMGKKSIVSIILQTPTLSIILQCITCKVFLLQTGMILQIMWLVEKRCVITFFDCTWQIIQYLHK